MTFLKDTKQSAIAPIRQPPAESRRFWLILGGGSIALHLVLLLGLRWMNFRATVATSTVDPTPIELVELAPDAPGGEAIAPAPESAASAPPASDQSVNDQPAAPPPAAPPRAAPPPAASVPEIAAAPPFIPPSPEVDAVPAPPSPPLPPSEEAPPTPAPPTPIPSPTPTPAPPTPASPPESTPTPAPPAPTTPPATAEPTPAQPGESPSASGESEPGESAPSGQPGQDGSGTPESGESQGGILDGLPPVPQPQAPPSFTAQVSVSQPSTNVSQQLAEPIDPARNFINDSSGSACGVISPDLVYFLGTPVEFLVRVDRDPSDPTIGRIAEDGITPQQGSGSAEYDAIATCLLREWTFRPPDTDAALENEAPSSQVIITMQIAPAP